MKRIVLISLFILSNICFGQQLDSIKTPLSAQEFEKAKEGYYQMSLTETYKKKWDAVSNFSKKMNNNEFDHLDDDQLWNDWIVNNIRSTNFASVEEANILRKLAIDLGFRQREENKELYLLLKRASIEQLGEIVQPDLEIAHH